MTREPTQEKQGYLDEHTLQMLWYVWSLHTSVLSSLRCVGYGKTKRLQKGVTDLLPSLHPLRSWLCFRILSLTKGMWVLMMDKFLPLLQLPTNLGIKCIQSWWWIMPTLNSPPSCINTNIHLRWNQHLQKSLFHQQMTPYRSLDQQLRYLLWSPRDHFVETLPMPFHGPPITIAS